MINKQIVMKMSQVQNFNANTGSNKFFLLQLLLLAGAVSRGWCLNLSYPSFPREVQGDFIITGDSYLVDHAIQVTRDIRGPNAINNISGRIVYKNPIKLWKQGRVASFNSTFVLKVTPEPNLPAGDGIAFILTKEATVPDHSTDQWMGIVNASTNGSSTSSIVAIEFDTKKSFPGDLDNNHIGLNINSINSIKKASLNSSGLIIASGKNLTAMILYNGVTKTMNISVFEGNFVGVEPPILSIPDLNLLQYLPDEVYFGFSASTGPIAIQRNCIREWYFTIDDIIDIGEDSKVPMWGWVVISLGIVVLLCGLGGYFYCKRETGSSDGYNLPIFSGVGPKKFKLKDLKAATANFNRKNELGRGGFGIVFRGSLDGQWQLNGSKIHQKECRI